MRRAKFAPREAATLISIAPNLDLIREKLAEQKEIDLQREKEAKLEKLAEAENGMAEEKEKSHLDASNFDPKTKQDKDGKYAPWMSANEIKRLKKANNKIKNKAKGKKMAVLKTEEKKQNNAATRNEAQDAKQRVLDALLTETNKTSETQMAE